MTTQAVRVWDLPTRLFHWLFALSFTVAFITHESDRYLDLHVYAGYGFFGLLLFRLLWGFIGNEYARFRSFLFTPAQTLGYLKSLSQGRPAHYVGHNPAGAWAIYLLLALGALVAGSGLLTLGVAEGQGPLAAFFAPERGEWWEEIHEVVSFFMLFVIGVHLLGVLVSSVLHKENLVRAMITGNKPGAESDEQPAEARRGGRHSLLTWAVLLTLVLGSGTYFQGYASDDDDDDHHPRQTRILADNPLWREECGSCHMAYHPSLLPARSWTALFAAQGDHFGEDLALDAETLAELSAFHRVNSAESGQSRAGYKILRGIAADAAPLRISETRYWRHEHDELNPAVWTHEAVQSRANCAACHPDAARNDFDEDAVRLPAGIRGGD